jgi:hypothetical protein
MLLLKKFSFIGGVNEVVDFVRKFKVSEDEVHYLKFLCDLKQIKI